MKTAYACLVLVLLAHQEAIGQFTTDKPKITRNYAAELNKPALATPESQRSWPIYREVMIAIARDEPKLWTHHRNEYWRILHNEPIVAHLKRQGSELQRAIAATKLPHLGHILADQPTADDLRYDMRHMDDYDRRRYQLRKPEAASENPDLMAVLIQPANQLGELCDCLAGHALLSATAGDSAAATNDIEAMFRIAGHLRDIPNIVGDLSSLRLFNSSLQAWGLILERRPDAFSDEQLIRLENAARAFARGQPLCRIAGERLNFADYAQRTFPDDGRGGGLLIRGGPSDYKNAEDLVNLFVPLSERIVLSRRKNIEAFDGLIAIGERILERPLWESDYAQYDEEAERIRSDKSLGAAATMVFRIANVHRKQEDAIQQRDAILAASAMHRFRIATGRLPTTLDELVPKYLPSTPIDRYSGKPLGYRIQAAKPILYSVGNDEIDGNAEAGTIFVETVDGAERRPWHGSIQAGDLPIDGDLILFPVQPQLPPIDRLKQDRDEP